MRRVRPATLLDIGNGRASDVKPALINKTRIIRRNRMIKRTVDGEILILVSGSLLFAQQTEITFK